MATSLESIDQQEESIIKVDTFLPSYANINDYTLNITNTDRTAALSLMNNKSEYHSFLYVRYDRLDNEMTWDLCGNSLTEFGIEKMKSRLLEFYPDLNEKAPELFINHDLGGCLSTGVIRPLGYTAGLLLILVIACNSTERLGLLLGSREETNDLTISKTVELGSYRFKNRNIDGEFIRFDGYVEKLSADLNHNISKNLLKTSEDFKKVWQECNEEFYVIYEDMPREPAELLLTTSSLMLKKPLSGPESKGALLLFRGGKPEDISTDVSSKQTFHTRISTFKEDSASNVVVIIVNTNNREPTALGGY